ncbi:toll/interleukin-1 receptor domain-containing protein [Candidatus Palauibacter sp.]|uniref:toll/interleukin-1 receptor domain-containing protein n=1 Tax=Candidatus Palauibacter sp. TaxID=3101350 RepID=UPI003B02D8B7
MNTPSPEKHGPDNCRDHLFISYAYEDGALAEWLALRLTSEGYKVWIDRFQLLGGESYPSDIDSAIKNRTFRMLGLLSNYSLTKPNPLKERTLALNLQQRRGEELLITLNVDGLRSDQIDWMTSDITFVPFWESWAVGLRQLLKKLASVDAPKGTRDGAQIAANAYLPHDLIRSEPELLYANLLNVTRLPAAITCYTVEPDLTSDDHRALADRWAFWAQTPRPSRHRGVVSRPSRFEGVTLYFSFDSPPCGFRDDSITWSRQVTASWRDLSEICELRTSSVIKPLIRRTMLHYVRRRGLHPTPHDPNMMYFPSNLLDGDRLRFRLPDGKWTYRKVVGERSWYGLDRFRYHQAVTFDIRTDLGVDFAAQFRIRLHITHCDGSPLTAIAANARRKSMTKSWYNEEWLARHFAMLSFLTSENDEADSNSFPSSVFTDSLLRLTAPTQINEAAIPKGTRTFADRTSSSESVADPGNQEGTN